jgi:primary-amine oxidase
MPSRDALARFKEILVAFGVAALAAAGCKPTTVSDVASKSGDTANVANGGSSSVITPAHHPLDDLSPEEVQIATNAVKTSGQFTDRARFAVVMAKEPTKEALAAGNPPRQAFCAVYEVGKRELHEVTVDLPAGKIADNKIVQGEPEILADEFALLQKIVKANPEWQAAMAKRGIKDFENEVQVDGWAPGLLSDKERASKARILRGLTYYKKADYKPENRGKPGNGYENFYARPVEGVVATVDMNAEKVVEVLDLEQTKIADGSQDFGEKEAVNQPTRPALKPLVNEMPQGPSFQIHGQEIIWQNWHFRYSMQPMMGLVLFDVGWEENGQVRSIAHKISLSEMVVPYSDPAKNWSFRNAFDIGEYGVGRAAHPLNFGGKEIDVPKHAVLLDANFANDDGTALKIPGAAAVYEREGGLMWKHLDQPTSVMNARIARDLVITFMTTVGNYDYGVNYIFHEDGIIDIEAQLTGILLAHGTNAETNPCGNDNECLQMVEKNVVAPAHQHFFSFRIDFDVDGVNNRPVEMTVKPIDSPDHNQFKISNRSLNDEEDAHGDMDLANQRMWKVINPTKSNALGHPVGYMLMPGHNSIPYLTMDSPIRKRANFVNHHMWFTRFHDNEQSAAGTYPNQSEPGQGLPTFGRPSMSLDNQDVVGWYTFGITHFPRPEEWPIMNVTRVGFKLLPINFFSRNPAMNIPAPDGSGVPTQRRDGAFELRR